MKLISFLLFLLMISGILVASGAVPGQYGIMLVFINLAAIILALPQKRK